MIKAAIFDFDGTLFGTEEIKQKLIAERREQLGITGENIEPGTVGGELPGYDVATATGMEYDEYIAGLYHFCIQNAEMKPGILEAIYGFRALGWKTAVASLGYSYRVKPLLEKYLAQAFDFVSLVDDIELTAQNPYPKRAVVAQALNGLNVRPTEVLAFEDSPSGVNGFLAAGVPANRIIVVPNSLTQGKQFPEGVRLLDSMLDMIPLNEFITSFG